MNAYDLGWNDGNQAIDPQHPENLAYMKGWLDGNSALEARENGHDPVWEN